MQNSRIRHARLAVAATFFLHGILFGTWVPHIPLAKDRLGVGTGTFGLALLAIALGGIIAMPVAGVLINRYGSARVCLIAGAAFCLMIIPPTQTADLFVFIAVALVFGMAIGSLDVAMNAHGIAVEKALRRPVMSLFHGMFSVGATAGAVAGAAALAVMPPTAHVLAASAVSLAVLVVAARYYLPADADKGLSGSNFAWPTRATIGLGLLCFLALMTEGAVMDWSTIMLAERFMIDAGTAALGYALFSAGMAVSRFTGDWARMRFGSISLLGWSAVLAAFGLAVALIVPLPVVAIVSLTLAGVGLGNAAPVLFAGGGRLEPSAPGRGIAAVTTLGYAGFLAGPPLIGFAAEFVGLPAALGLIVLASLIIAVFARAAGAADRY
ncbi:MAG: MFS transporter [Parvibaculaceae bacterium]